jgi:hypothetical protein
MKPFLHHLLRAALLALGCLLLNHCGTTGPGTRITRFTPQHR